MRTCPSLLSEFVVQVAVISSLVPRTCVAQAEHEVWYIVSCPKVFTSPRALSYTTPLMSSTPSPGTCTPSFTVTRPTSFSSEPLPGEIQPCADLRQLSVGSLAEAPTFTGYEPKQLAEHEDHRHRRQVSCRTRGFTCQPPVLPPTEHSVDLRIC